MAADQVLGVPLFEFTKYSQAEMEFKLCYYVLCYTTGRVFTLGITGSTLSDHYKSHFNLSLFCLGRGTLWWQIPFLGEYSTEQNNI